MKRLTRDRVGFVAFAVVLLSLTLIPRAYAELKVTSAVTEFVTESGSVSRMYAALDQGNQVYLVVWSSFAEVTKGQFLNVSGKPISAPFQIVPGASGYSRVVRGANEFLVTYQRSGNPNQRWGRSVKYVNGAPELGPEFFIANVFVDSDAGMAFVPAAGHYLVTSWNLSGGYRSYVTGVKADGTITIPTTWVTDTRSDTASPEISCDPASNRCLMIGYGDAKYTWARFIDGANGSFTSPLLTVDSGSLQEDHNVEWNATDQRFLAVYVSNRASIVAKRVFADGSADATATTVIAGNYGQLNLAYNPTSDSFVATFKDGSATNLEYCWVQEFNGNGAVVPGQLWKVSTQATAGNAAPVVVANPQRSEFLFVQTRNYTAGDAGVLAATKPDNTSGGGGGTPPPPPAPASAPAMSLDTPTDGNAFRVPISLYGWAADKGASSGTGVDAVHVWAYPNPGSGQPALFVGAATYGQPRGDVAAALGDARFTNSGFSMPLSNLAAGVYQLVVSARSTVTGTFNQARTATVVIRGPLVALDGPAQNAQVKAPFVISGWAADSGAGSGTGVDAVHVWVYPNPGSGATPLFLGAAAYGQARPDVAQALGASRFTNSGYSMSGLNLRPGPYLLVAFAHMAETGQWVPATASITVAAGPLMYVDAPVSGQSITVGSIISGWAADMSSPTGTGVDTVHVWAYPANGAAPIFVGQANYGSDRPDVAGYIGDRFRFSGFWLPMPRLAPGGYWFVAFARNATTQQFTNAVAVAVQVF